MEAPIGVTQKGNYLIKENNKIRLCCKGMAKEICEHPHENYSYLQDGKGGIRHLYSIKEGNRTPLFECPYCNKRFD